MNKTTKLLIVCTFLCVVVVGGWGYFLSVSNKAAPVQETTPQATQPQEEVTAVPASQLRPLLELDSVVSPPPTFTGAADFTFSPIESQNIDLYQSLVQKSPITTPEFDVVYDSKRLKFYVYFIQDLDPSQKEVIFTEWLNHNGYGSLDLSKFILK